MYCNKHSAIAQNIVNVSPSTCWVRWNTEGDNISNKYEIGNNELMIMTRMNIESKEVVSI